MVSERLLQLSQPLERRLNVKYEQQNMVLGSPRTSNYSSKPLSLYYDRLMSLAEPRYRRKKYVDPEIEYNNKKNKNSSSSLEIDTTKIKHANRIIKSPNKREQNLVKLNIKAAKMKESDQITRMNRKMYVAVASNEEKTPKKFAEERLMNLATPRHRREKFNDSNIQYDVKYHSSQSMRKLSQMNKQSALSSLSSSQHRYKEVLQLAEDIKKYKDNVITEMIIPKYLRKQPKIDDGSNKVSKILNKKSISNVYNDDIFNKSFIRTQSELRFLRKQIILSRKFKTRVSSFKKFPTTILWPFTKSKTIRGKSLKKLRKIKRTSDTETYTNHSETHDVEWNSEQHKLCDTVKTFEQSELYKAENS